MKGSLPEDYPNTYLILMLRNALEDFFSSIKNERDFDFPLISLLRAMGYYDIHFTHGDREIGKDFIAKKLEDGIEYQYSFQSIEAEIIAVKLVGNGLLYEAITLYLALARVVMDAMYDSEDEFLREVYLQIVNDNLIPLCKTFREECSDKWNDAESKLLVLVGEASKTMPMLHYIVWCSRILEINSLYFFLTDEKKEREEVSKFMVDFIEKEPGCGHVPGDRHAISVVWTVLALLVSQKETEAINFSKRNLLWLCDRMQKGFGLPRYDAKEYEETATLLGYPFSFIKVQKDHSSFLATAVSDLAAFIGDKDFYAAVVNDFEACEIAYTYWQFPDTKAIFTVSTNESRTYPNIPHQSTLNDSNAGDYAEHIKFEPDSFRITEKTGMSGLVLLSVLLKDRYFPKMWPQIVASTNS